MGTNSMEVIIISSIDPDIAPTGTGTYIKNLVNSLSKKEIKCTFIGITTNGTITEKDSIFIPIVKNVKHPYPNYKFLINLFLKSFRLKITKNAILHAQRPDFMFPFVIFFPQNPKICTLHGNPCKAIHFCKGFFTGKMYEAIEKIVLKRIDKVIIVDIKTKNYYLTKYPWLANKIILIPVGFDSNKFKPLETSAMRRNYGFTNNDKIILYVGRLMREKGLDLLLKAYKKTKDELKNVKLMIVGDGQCNEKLKALAVKLNVADVIFTGSIEPDGIPEIMNCADVFVLCSLYEGLPTVVLEALACGVPVISTDVGDVHKIVKDGVTGYIVKKRTEEELKNKLISVLREDKILKENCISSVRYYSWNEVSKKIICVYNEVLEKK